MSCYHPLKAIVNGETANGKKNLKILSSGWLAEYQARNGHPFPAEHLVTLPCGQCVGCRLEHSRQWANRCMLELKDHKSAYFVTLTYDNDHVPVSYYADPNTGEALEALSLSKRDWQLFMKRLRKAHPSPPLRFFMAGEYGSTTFRPHYHAIIFGLELNDLVPYKRSEIGYQYYTSETLQKVWSVDGVPIGYVVVGEVTWETCAYTARYVMKKLNGDLSEFYKFHNIEPEFTLMSRRPGIARNYYETHPEIYETEKINLATEKGGISFRPPRYFDKLFDLEHPEEMQLIRERRAKTAADAMAAQLEKTSVSEDEYLLVKEHYKQDAIKSLRRNVL